MATNFEDNNGDIQENTYTLMLCNALGTPLDTKQVSKTTLLKVELSTEKYLNFNVKNHLRAITIQSQFMSFSTDMISICQSHIRQRISLYKSTFPSDQQNFFRSRNTTNWVIGDRKLTGARAALRFCRPAPAP